MFQGDFKYVKAEMVGDKVRVSSLTPKEAADPTVSAGVLVTLSNGIDRLIVIGDDVYKLIHETTDLERNAKSIAITWHAKKLPKEAGDEVIAMLNLKER